MKKDFRQRRSKFRYQLLGMLLLCISLIALFSNVTLAWFKDSSTTSNGEPNITVIGTLSLDVTTNFNFYNLALAPDRIYTTDARNEDIATYVKTSNAHDIDGCYVRIKFENKRLDPNTMSLIDNFDLVDLYFDGNRTFETSYSASVIDKWYYYPYVEGNLDSGYYYYIGGVYGTNVMFNRGYKTTNSYTNDIEDLDVRMTYTVEAIQRQYGAYLETWPSAPAIFKDFATSDHAVHLSEKNQNTTNVTSIRNTKIYDAMCLDLDNNYLTDEFNKKGAKIYYGKSK